MKKKGNFLNTRTFKFNKSFVLNCRSTNIGLTAEKIRLLFGIQSAGLYEPDEFRDNGLLRNYQWNFNSGYLRQKGLITLKDDLRTSQTFVRIELNVEFEGKHDHPLIRSLLRIGGDEWFADTVNKFKQLIETGEIATTQGQSHGERSVVEKGIENTKLYFNEQIERALANPQRTLVVSEVNL